MQKYIGDIITEARRDTRNTDTNSISTEDFLRYANYAQERLYGLIQQRYSWVFTTKYEISLTAGEDEYTVPDNVYLGTRFLKVEYSPDGSVNKYSPLYPASNNYQTQTYSGQPYTYHREYQTIILEPTPTATQGKIRVTYERALDRLDTRRGRVNGTPSGTTIDLTSTSFGAPSTADEALFVENAYCCISDAFGTPMLYNGVISSYNSTTDAITLAANVSTYLVTGYALADLANGYFTLGKYSTTHSKLPDAAERYLQEYVNWKIFRRDSSNDSSETNMELKEIEQEILASYALADKTVKLFPVSDYSLLIPGIE